MPDLIKRFTRSGVNYSKLYYLWKEFNSYPINTLKNGQGQFTLYNPLQLIVDNKGNFTSKNNIKLKIQSYTKFLYKKLIKREVIVMQASCVIRYGLSIIQPDLNYVKLFKRKTLILCGFFNRSKGHIQATMITTRAYGLTVALLQAKMIYLIFLNDLHFSKITIGSLLTCHGL